MLPSEAPMPPCAATVCERVGKTLDSTATLRPARASCSDACMPEPPAPTMTTSNLRRAREEVVAATSESPEHLHGPAGAADEPDEGEHLQGKAPADRFHVVHPHVAHPDPRVPGEGQHDHEGQHPHPLRREEARPLLV